MDGILDVLLMYPKAFCVGGFLCAIGQVFIMKTKLASARILVGYVTAGVILGALGLYKPLVDFAGAGATVPLTGFGYTLAHGEAHKDAYCQHDQHRNDAAYYPS